VKVAMQLEEHFNMLTKDVTTILMNRQQLGNHKEQAAAAETKQ
jgi:hypothetical protein